MMTAPDQQKPDAEPHAGQEATLKPGSGVSAQEPAEGSEDANPPVEGSPRG
jgi:hypothetical protein